MADDLEFRIAKLEVKPGDVLVFKFASEFNAEIANHFQKVAENTLPEGSKWLFLGHDCDLSVLTFDEIHSRIIETPAVRDGGRMDLEVEDA